MTKAEISLGDLIIKKCPLRTAFSMSGFMSSNILMGMHDVWGEELYQEVDNLANSRNGAIRTFLLTQDYFEIINHSIPYDMLTPKGEKARELGGHNEYLIWKEQQDKQEVKKNKKLTFTQRNWLPIALITLIIGWFGDLGKQVLTLKYFQPQTVNKIVKDTIVQVVHDTVDIYRKNTYQSPKMITKEHNQKKLK